jgi:hypothetical protein
MLLATMGAKSVQAGYEQDWLGAPMFWSHFDVETSLSLVCDSGLEIVAAREETEYEFGKPATFLWVMARKTAAQ